MAKIHILHTGRNFAKYFGNVSAALLNFLRSVWICELSKAYLCYVWTDDVSDLIWLNHSGKLPLDRIIFTCCIRNKAVFFWLSLVSNFAAEYTGWIREEPTCNVILKKAKNTYLKTLTFWNCVFFRERDLWNNYEYNTRDHCYIYKHGLLFMPNRRHKYITARIGFILYNASVAIYGSTFR